MQEKLKIFLSHAWEDKKTVLELYDRLKTKGFDPWTSAEDLLPGQDWQHSIEEALRSADVFLVCLSSATSRSRFVGKEIRMALDIWKTLPQSSIFVIPVLLEPCEIPEELQKIYAVRLYEEDGFQLLIKSLRSRAKHLERALPTLSREIRNFVITEIDLVNIRCFEKLNVSLDGDDGLTLWTMILGDNAAGKSTLLRSIALGLCQETDAVALMRAGPGGFVRHGAKEGRIRLRLREQGNNAQTYTITTRIIKTSEDEEIVRQKTNPSKDFPWSNLFVCGYGTNRSAQTSASYENYNVRDAVLTLFDYNASLQNPEVVLLRRGHEVRKLLEQKLLRILMLDAQDHKVVYSKSGMELTGAWGKHPFNVLSDGYRTTSNWVLDFIGWLIYAERLNNTGDIGGILLIDELEQHLHPRWQRYIVQRLRTQFPATQIIATTHTPLAASGIIDIENSLLLKLKQSPDGAIDKRIIDKKMLAGKRADQVLASEAFGLVTTRNPGSEDDFDRYVTLLGKKERTPDEDAKLQKLGAYLHDALRNSEGELAQTVEKAVDHVLKDMVEKVGSELLDLETKKQIREIFKPEESE